MVTPREIMEKWPKYKVSSQVKEGDNIVIRDIKAQDTADLFLLLRRLHGTSDLTSLAFLEIHRYNPDNTVSVIFGDSTKPWPKSPAIEHHNVVISAKPRNEVDIKPGVGLAANLLALKNKQKQNAIACTVPPPPSSLAIIPPTNQQQSAAPKAHDDGELGRGVVQHKREVA